MGFSSREEGMVGERLGSSPASDALLLSTVCAIGRLVEVQVKDGSIYSGVFHTASVDDGYGIVLKKARVIEKGKFYSNLNAGALLDTLVVLSNDLVQVVVKDFLLTRECSVDHYACDRPWEGIDSSDLQNNDAASSENQEKEDLSLKGSDVVLEARDVTKSPKSLDCACAAFEGRPCAAYGDEAEKKYLMPVASAHVRESEVHPQINSRNQTDTSTAVHHSCASFVCPLEENAIKENHDGFTAKESRNQEISSPILPSPATKSTSNVSAEAPSSVAETSTPSTSSSSVSIDNSSAFPLLSASSSFRAIKGNSFYNTYTKEFKLNPEAKVFVPSFMSARSTSAVNPPIVSTSNAVNIPPLMPIAAAQSSSEINSFPRFTPLPTKFVQYGPLVAGQSGICPQFAPPVLGHVHGCQQQVRYNGSYHHSVQAGNIYMHQDIQPVMFGRAGQLFYVRALSQDPVQGTTILSQGFPVSTPCQTNMPKLEGTQSLPFCMNLPVVTASMHPYTSSIPFLPPVPNVRSLTIPGVNGFVGNKFN